MGTSCRFPQRFGFLCCGEASLQDWVPQATIFGEKFDSLKQGFAKFFVQVSEGTRAGELGEKGEGIKQKRKKKKTYRRLYDDYQRCRVVGEVEESKGGMNTWCRKET